MESVTRFIEKKLSERAGNSSLRRLTSSKNLIDFCSNDYLGFARSQHLKSLIEDHLKQHPSYQTGATGSRLISGNDDFTERLESEIALFHHAEAALIFNSGYDANLGLFSSLPQRGDTVILDELIHASIIDGARLSHANRYTFKHNDLNSLEDKLKLAKGNIFVGVESIYSMDGDEAPLRDIIRLTEKYSAALIIDEAHATGIFGKNGRGLVEHYDLSEKVFARTITFGKALGCHGAAVIGSVELRKYLVNFARSFIFSTAASFYTHLSVSMAYKHLLESDLSSIHQKINLFTEHSAEIPSFIKSRSPIQSLVIQGNDRAKKMAANLQTKGFDLRAILHPTVPSGKERLRICLHTFNSDKEITDLIKAIKETL
ncbi:aminotransferase class I/II-fold pyridoxal phosphate-dependent enzyme [Paradesertivirga mongoliensis]|uniref:Aminotransferase class I/II-fold pyridoxal phosphate-dependent enzyme n=1 Tax=Paradesertivirga mongoliensis TaxID=2100740 RepID=A0ABW4ZMW0_9SPHI|nr:8-amino-7-oxononanoate synthase [Pedobacter mongoliensis]